ncbi:MAG: DUF1365 domain-containing protein [Pseudomonadota bacterium]
MHSCIYEGRVRHTRTEPVLHRFRYRMFQMYLDLDELDTLFAGRWLWSTRRFALARFRRSDHIGADAPTLKAAVADLVEAETGKRPGGPVRLLTNLSYYGFCFNPVSFYYCFDQHDEKLETIVAEVHNTPWGERSTYVLPASQSISGTRALRFQPKKHMHVSPFMQMDIDYDWCFTEPASRTTVFMANSRDGRRFFDAAMLMHRKEISGFSLARVLVMFPFMTFKVVGAIYWQALRLWLKRVPFYPHPDQSIRVQTR